MALRGKRQTAYFSLAEVAEGSASVFHRKDAEDAENSIFILIAETRLR
jgi:hypothetical protein